MREKSNHISPEKPFPIVGIGASAGGLDAFKKLFEVLPADTGMAFVLVQHLAPTYVSILSELLARVTAMPVTEAKDGMAVEPNHVYVIPPNMNMAILHGALSLARRKQDRGLYLPINYFFRSLAEDLDGMAIGVILSGTGSDGTEGLKAIKAESGITFAQDPESAEQDGMPQSAIAASAVDFVMPPADIASELVRIARHPYLTRYKTVEAEEPQPEIASNLYNKLFVLLRRATGTDFTYYKQATIERRVTRRMALLKIEKLEDYLSYLQDNSTEAQVLYQDILIMVTEFFRDADAFDALKREVFPRIVKSKTPETPLRVWVPGCSTGQEAYSIAISLLEFLETISHKPPVQIFATDINERDIETARVGIYSENITKEISPERLSRFFTRIDRGYQINKSIREICVFAKHDVTKDPPFSKQDLISFRNVMIYFSSVLQKRVIPVFHYALNADGFLMLGTSESIGEFSSLFNTVDNKYRIYTKKAVTAKLPIGFPNRVLPSETAGTSAETVAPGRPVPPAFDVLKEADRLVLENYAPAGFVINDKMEILQFYGHTGPYLEPSTGKASLNLMKMLRQSLSVGVYSAVHEARRSKSPASEKGLIMEEGEQRLTISLEVVPITDPSGGMYYIVLFEGVEAQPSRECEEAVQEKIGEAKRPDAKDREIAQVRRALVEAEKRLQTTVEEKDTTNEELRAANEEIQSSNEELQSINEELETAKEELQSTNEELVTVNEELQSRNIELGQVNDDLNNLIKSTDIPILILGGDLRIRRFTPTVEKILSVIPSDIGRPVSDIKRNIDVPDLEKMALNVIANLGVRMEEVRDKEGHWYSMQIRPYKTADNRIDGVVMAFLDIDVIKRSLKQVEDARDFAENIVETLWEPLLILDADLRVHSANRAFYRVFRVLKEETEGRLVYDLGNKQWDIPQLRELLEKIVPQRKTFEGFTVEHTFQQIGHKIMLLNARMIDQTGVKPLILLAIEDATERRQSERLSNALNEFDTIINSTLDYREIMRRVVAESAKAMECESAAIYLLEDGRWRLRYAYGLPSDIVGANLTQAEARVASLAAETGETLAVNDALSDPRFNHKLLKRFEVRAFLTTPLFIRGMSIGALSFNYHSAPAIFTSAQIDFANKLGTSISLALENARLYEAERNIADILQESLLIMPDSIKGVEFGYLYHSAAEAAKVGGDFYDIFEIDGERIGIVLGDVSGKGVDAAALTAVVKNTIKAYAYDNVEPSFVMTKANEMVMRSSPPSIFVTVVYAVLNRRTNEIIYCCAGHPPAIIKKRSSDIELLEEYSPIIGAFKNMRYSNGKTALKKGDVLILYTDGVIEARNNSEFFEEDRLVNFIKESGSIPTKAMPEAIFNRVLDFTGGRLSDDAAILTVSLA